MKYLSTRDSSLNESFSKILFKGLSNDGGLYLPKVWPSINIENLKEKSYQEIAVEIIYPFVESDLSKDDLEFIINKTYKNFRHKKIAPLKNIDDNKFILELFYGPTYAFKDYALQFLGNLFSKILENSNKKITILGATSGDTGSSAINAFKGNKNIKVFILHPFEKVSEVQRRQMTTVLDQNIHNIALKGNFDDCQSIVKKLFLDSELQSHASLTAVNSINWARIIAQTVYYFWAFLESKEKKVNFIVPTGNFGNIFSARVAKKMGLPIDELHVVTNENDILNNSIKEGKMIIKNVKETLSPSMDIQISSNFERQIFESAGRKSDLVIKIMSSFLKDKEHFLDLSILKDIQSIYKSHSISNSETLETIKFYKEKYNYLADPHTSTGLQILKNIKSNNSSISLACAHPSKFGEAIKIATGIDPELPIEIKNLFDKEEKLIILDNDIQAIKNYIIEKL